MIYYCKFRLKASKQDANYIQELYTATNCIRNTFKSTSLTSAKLMLTGEETYIVDQYNLDLLKKCSAMEVLIQSVFLEEHDEDKLRREEFARKYEEAEQWMLSLTAKEQEYIKILISGSHPIA